MFREVKGVIKHEIQPNEPEKIEFEPKEEESDSVEEEELEYEENKQCESITHKAHMHRDFPLDPKTGTTSLIFHYVSFNVTIHIYICRSIQYNGLKSIASNTMNRKTIASKNHVQKSCTKP